MIWRSILYDRPEAMLLLLLLPLLFWLFYFLYQYRKSSLNRLGTEELIKQISIQRPPLFYWLKAIFFLLAWAFAVIAFTSPKGNERYVSPVHESMEQKEKGPSIKQIYLLIDVSASMGPSQLDLAKQIADLFVSQLHGENVGLFAFTDATIKIVPPTADYLFTRMMLNGLQINEGETEGTNIKQALEFLNEHYFSTYPDISKALVIFSDGGDTSLYQLEGEALFQAKDSIVQSLKRSRENHVTTYVVGLGPETLKPIPNIKEGGRPVLSKQETSLLQKLAAQGGGEYFNANEISPLQIASQLQRAIDKQFVLQEKTLKSPVGGFSQLVYDDYFQIPLGISIFFLSLALLLPSSWKKKKTLAALMILLPHFLAAQNIDSYYQKAKTYYEAEDYATARSEFQSLIDLSSAPWQKQIILYDIATSYLAEGDWKKALDQLQTINLDQSPLVLKERVLQNRSAALLQGIQDSLKENDPIPLFFDFLLALSAAERAQCELSLAEGAKECVPRSQLNEMKNEARRLLQQLAEKAKKNPLDALRVQYLNALFQDAPSTESLNQLQSLQNNLGSQMKESKDYAMAQKFLTKAIESEDVKQHLYLFIAGVFVDSLAQEPPSNKEILKQALYEEKKVLRLSRIAETVEKDEEIQKLLAELQQSTNATASKFIPAVKEMQKAYYERRKEDKTTPWDAVIPLFLEGQRAADQSLEALKNGEIDKAIAFQERTVKLWEEALQSMQNMQEESKEEKSSSASAAPHAQSQSSLNDVVRLLQDMENEDKSKPALIEAPGKKNVERPW